MVLNLLNLFSFLYYFYFFLIQPFKTVVKQKHYSTKNKCQKFYFATKHTHQRHKLHAYKISLKGIMTNSRSSIKGWGITRSGSFTFKSSYIKMSISIIRSWYSPSTDLPTLPISHSIFCVAHTVLLI